MSGACRAVRPNVPLQHHGDSFIKPWGCLWKDPEAEPTQQGCDGHRGGTALFAEEQRLLILLACTSSQCTTSV